MSIRPTNNPMLGIAIIGRAYEATDANLPPLGTIVSGFNDATGTTDEYIFLVSPANIIVNDEVDWDATTMVATEVAAPGGGAIAVVASGNTQRAFFRLKRRPQAAT